MNLLTLLYFILGLSLLVFVHELGHFIAAKIFGVYVYEFSLFMGPKLVQFQIGETKYTLRLLPIGGYCSMAGEEDSQATRNKKELEESKSENDIQNEVLNGVIKEKNKETLEELPEVPLNRSMLGIKNWKKIIIMAAGAFNNIVLCFILMLIYFGNIIAPKVSVKENSFFSSEFTSETSKIDYMSITFYESEYYDSTTHSQEEIKNHLQGVVYNDKIESYKQIEEMYNQSYVYFVERLEETNGLDYDLVNNSIYQEFEFVLDDGQEISLTRTIFITLNESKSECINYDSLETLGFICTNEHNSFSETISKAFNTEIEMAGLIYRALGQLFTKDGMNNVSGVVGMYTAAKTFMNYGTLYYVYYLALISVNLGIMNLLPFPALDGGRILLTIIETITKKKVPSKVEGIINGVGFGLLILLMIVVTVKDVLGLFNGAFLGAIF